VCVIFLTHFTQKRKMDISRGDFWRKSSFYRRKKRVCENGLHFWDA